MSSNEKPRCPRCGGEAIRIVYGFPTFETFEAAERGEVMLGGCVEFGEPATLHCPTCDADQ